MKNTIEEPKINEDEYLPTQIKQEDNGVQGTFNSMATKKQGLMIGLQAGSHLNDNNKPKRSRPNKDEVDEFIKERNKKHIAKLKKLKKKVNKAVASGTLEKLSGDKEYRDMFSEAYLSAEFRVVELKNGEKRILRELYEKIPSKPPEFKRTSNNFVVCVECKMKVGNTVAEQSDHIEKSHRRQFLFKCLLCNAEFEINSEYESTPIHQHIRRVHLKEDQYYQCEKCKRSFWIKYKYDKHVEKCTGGVPHYSGICTDCGRFCKNLGAHMKTHQPRSYHCLKCPLTFRTQGQLTTHNNNVHTESAEKQAVCGDCGKIFKTLSYLTSHRGKVHPKTLHKCTYQDCNKEFKTKDALKKHAFIHSDEKPMSCEYCEFTCRQRNSMDVHMNTHHKDKPYDRPRMKRYGIKVKGQHINLDQ